MLVSRVRNPLSTEGGDPRHVLEIARLLDQSGKAALVEYQRFLEIWQSADPDLPELTEARRAVARLRGN